MWTTHMLPHAVGCIGTLLVRAHICVSDCIQQKHSRSCKHKTKSANNQTESTSSQNLYHNLINHLSDNCIAVNRIWWHCSSGNEWSTYCISSYSFRRNYSFLNFEFVANSKVAAIFQFSYLINWIFAAEIIQGRKLFKGRNYMRKYGINFYMCEDLFSTSKLYCLG